MRDILATQFNIQTIYKLISFILLKYCLQFEQIKYDLKKQLFLVMFCIIYMDHVANKNVVPEDVD